MNRWSRWTPALLLCCAGLVGLGPTSTAQAAPSAAADAGVGTVVADLGQALEHGRPGFSFDGRYYSYLVASGDRCDLRLYDVGARRTITLEHAHVVCDGNPRWAAQADTLVWRLNAAAGEVTVYAWDADPGRVTVLAADAHVFATSGVSADGRYLAFTGRSDNHPAPTVDAPRDAGYVYDRGAGVSLPLSTPDTHVEFGSWAPKGANFVASYGGRTPYDPKDGACLGTRTACRVRTDRYAYFGPWSADGTAVIGGPDRVVYDFTDGSFTPFPTRYGHTDFSFFVNPDADHVVAYLSTGPGSILWDRRTGLVSKIPGPNGVWASPTGRYLLYRGEQPHSYRYRDLSSGSDAPATYRGTVPGAIDGYWTKDGSSFFGVGPGGCSSLRQWSPTTNTVSLFGPPGLSTCYAVPQPFELDPLPSSVSGRFAVAYRQRSGGGLVEYVADLRRHVLLGPVRGQGNDFAPAGSDLLAVEQPTGAGPDRLLLVDPTPSPDVDDKPRWSVATPATGAQVQTTVGGQVHLQLGASDLQGTPVSLYFRGRDAEGVPIASAPKGWSCERRRLAAGATVADCTFAPPKDYTAVRFLDVSATNYTTGAQSDTRAYRVGVRS